MAATLKDVASRAGVSTGVASTILNGARSTIRVSDETRKRILDAAKILRYRPNIMARGLRCKRTGMVGVVTPRVDWGHWPKILQGIEDVLEEVDCNLILCTTEEDSKTEARKLLLLRDKGVDGILTVPAWETQNLALYDGLLRGDLPFVSMLRPLPLPGCPFVCVNPRKMGELAASHLVELGHRKIVLMGQFSPEYRSGFVETALDMGVSLKDIKTVELHKWDVESGVKLAELVLKDFPDITAVHACNDYMALGAIEYFGRNGIRVPEDISVLGANDYEIGEFSRLKISTVGQPKKEQGRAAAELLLGMIDGKPGENLILEPYLIVRNSTAVAKKR